MPRGAGIVKGVDSKEIDNPEFVSIATYFNVRKRDPPHTSKLASQWRILAHTALLL